jgi:hypothetical protein
MSERYYEGDPVGKAGQFGASINGDCITESVTRRAITYVDCARFVRHLGKASEIIEVYGPAGVRRFRLEGPALLLRRVQRRASDAPNSPRHPPSPGEPHG